MTVFDNTLRILAAFFYTFLTLATWTGNYTFLTKKIDSEQTTLLFKVFTSVLYIIAILLLVGKFLTV